MPFDDYLPLLHSLGWLAALMFAAVWSGLPGSTGRRHAGWLLGFCAARLLIAAHALLFPVSAEWRQLTTVLSGTILWEFARQVWNADGRRRISAATHWVALETLALLAAVTRNDGPAHPSWFLPIDLLYAILPGLLGGGGAWLLWRCMGQEPDARRRAALRVAIAGLAFYGLPWIAGGVLPPWFAAIGLGWACFTIPAARTPAALSCAAGLALVALVGPPAVAVSHRLPDAAETADLLSRVERAAAPLQGKFATRLQSDRLDPATREALRSALVKIRADDPLVHAVSLWRLRDNRVLTVDLTTGEFSSARAAGELERAAGWRPDAFVVPADPAAGRAVVTVCAPLSPGRFESPAAWLALEFPEVFWEIQREHARHTGIALVSVLAAFCALGFVLVVRQRLESDQQLHLERAQAADRAKSEFLAFLGHELRTPLQTILGRAELLRAQPAAARHAAAIDAQGRLLLRLVTDLLDLGTIESGHFLLHPAPFSLRQTLTTTEDAVRPAAATKQLALTFVVDPAVPDLLVGDEARLRQILGNLLGNAVKYTPVGSVSLMVGSDSADAGRARLVFRVRDTGPGLPVEKIPQLFTLFTRLDAGDTFSREGTGVGLALVRRLSTLMGGTVAAANHPDGGAEFTVRLEFARAAIRTAALPESPPASVPNSRAQGILLVEDNRAVAELLAEMLAVLGHEVTTVADGPAALAAAVARRFDVAVLDVNLPGIDGVAVARQLRARHPAIRLVGCSAEALPEVRAAALAAGCDEFLVKPVSLDALARAIDGTTPAAGAGNVFARLGSSTAIARTRELLRQDWVRLRAETETALAGGDAAAPRRLAHYLQSSALLLADAALLLLCQQLAASAGANAALDAIEHHLAAWAGESVAPDLQPGEPIGSTVEL